MKIPSADEQARFAVHASPQAIAKKIDLTERWIGRLNTYLQYLERLAVTRARQMERGEWP